MTKIERGKTLSNPGMDRRSEEGRPDASVDVLVRLGNTDWSRSSLGPVEDWPDVLGSTVRLMMASGFPMFLAWGPGLSLIYNDAYRVILGDKHPDAFGAPFREVWREIWDDLSPPSRSRAGGAVQFRQGHAADHEPVRPG